MASRGYADHERAGLLNEKPSYENYNQWVSPVTYIYTWLCYVSTNSVCISEVVTIYIVAVHVV